MRRICSMRAVVVAALVCAGCAADSNQETDLDEQKIELDPIFDAAAAEFDVPADLLESIGYAKTGLEMVEGGEELAGLAPAFGVMALRGDLLRTGAALAGTTEEAARYDEEANIRAAAALLSADADDLGIDRGDPGAWAPAVGRMSGIEDEEARIYQVWGVYDVLQRGVTVTREDGRVIARIQPTEVTPDMPPVPRPAGGGNTDYPSAIWRPSPNQSARSSGSIGDVAMVIIHTCEGSYAGCWGWLKNPAAGASAHYVVSEDGGEITQLVHESRKAWHIAADYNCSRNQGTDCWRNGYNSNNFTIGIEHAGFASQSSWPNGQLEASAALVCDITRRYGIPRDRQHILGHGELQPWNRTDPGANWPWAHYINRVRAYCNDDGGDMGGGDGGDMGGGDGGDMGGGGAGAGTILVDSNNANNDQNVAKVEVSGDWHASAYTGGYYGTGYWWADADYVADGASFWFYLDDDATRTVDAWWTAGGNRATNAPFVAFDASGNKLGAAIENQQTQGKQWVPLGTWSFTKGWNRIVVSRWATKGKVVIADAIRIH